MSAHKSGVFRRRKQNLNCIQIKIINSEGDSRDRFKQYPDDPSPGCSSDEMVSKISNATINRKGDRLLIIRQPSVEEEEDLTYEDVQELEEASMGLGESPRSHYSKSSEVLAKISEQPQGFACSTPNITLATRLSDLEKHVKDLHADMMAGFAEQKRDMQYLFTLLAKRNGAAAKPTCIPIQTIDQLLSFDLIEGEQYEEVIAYFGSIGGGNAKEMANHCFKQAIAVQIVSDLTWLGRDEKLGLHDRKIISAIYEATCRSIDFSKPTRLEFVSIIKTALRSAQERLRKHSKQPQRRCGDNP